jgi:endoglucanase
MSGNCSIFKREKLLPPNLLAMKYAILPCLNAGRPPWRIGIDYLLHGDSSAKIFTEKINRWITDATNSDVSHISEG